MQLEHPAFSLLAEVRIAAKGPHAANVLGILNQTDLFHIVARALGIE